MVTHDELFRCMDDLEARIDDEVEGALRDGWVSFTDGRLAQGCFRPRRLRSTPAGTEWPVVSANAGMDDYDSVILQQLRMCSEMLASGNGALMCVRPNYGTGILPSVFGAELFVMDNDLDTLPTSRPLDGGLDAVRALIDRGVPEIRTGLGGRCFEMAARYAEVTAAYPKIARWARLYHPDTQGPMDICELLVGSAIFTHVYDEPDVIHALLRLVTETYISYMKEWFRIAPQPTPYGIHWGLMHGGYIMLRDDSAMNFSPAMFDEFVRPYDQAALHAFGGGAIHFCGRGDHFIESMSQMSGLSAIAMSQPHLNDMTQIFASTIDRGIKLLGLAISACPAGSLRDLRGQAQTFE